MDRKSTQYNKRATSQTRLLGFEPVGETVEDTLNNNFSPKTHQKTQQSIERPSRSQAVKKVSKQGANQSSEEVFLLKSGIEGKGNSANESVEVANLCQANNSQVTVILDEGNTVDVLPLKKVKKNDVLVSSSDKTVERDDESDLHHLKPKFEEREKDESSPEDISKQNKLSENAEEVPFKIKLKKTEHRERKPDKAKLKLPNLKHHEFENEAQCTETEEETDVKLKRRISDIEDITIESEKGSVPTDEEKVLKEAPIPDSLFQKEEEGTDDESYRLEPGIHDLKFSQKLKADKIIIQNSEDKTRQVFSEIEPVNTVLRKPLEHENQDFELTINRMPSLEDKDINSEESIAQTIKMPQSQPNLDMDKKFCSMEETNETIQIDKPLIDSIPNNKKGPINKKDATKSEEPLFRQGLKLRKTETVKRPIEKAAIEVPKLKHHAFENVPQDVIEEQNGNIKLSRLLPQLTKKKKKKQFPKEMEEEPPQEMLTIEVPEEKIEVPPQGMLTIEAPERRMELDAVEPVVKSDNSTNKAANEKVLVSEQKVEKRLPLTKQVDRNQKENRPENSEPAFTQGLKLKKTEVVKKQIEKPLINLPRLKHHEFESVPQEMEAEQVSDVKLSTLLPQPNGKEKKIKTKRQNDLPTKEEKKIVNTPTEMEFTPNEETTSRKEIDEIVKRSAAISKKHSDTEKVELPAFLNFPSDQGISVSEGTTEETKNLSRSPTGIIESVQESCEPKAPIVEKQVLTRAGKQVKSVPQKSNETCREIPIIVEGTKTTESMTNETVIESEVSFSLFFHPSSLNLCIASNRGT